MTNDYLSGIIKIENKRYDRKYGCSIWKDLTVIAMAMEIVKPKLDVVFKKIFGDSENINILKGFLADILDIPIDEITDVTFDDTEVPPDEIEEKFVRFDMSLTTNKGLINVEIQPIRL